MLLGFDLSSIEKQPTDLAMFFSQRLSFQRHITKSQIFTCKSANLNGSKSNSSDCKGERVEYIFQHQAAERVREQFAITDL